MPQFFSFTPMHRSASKYMIGKQKHAPRDFFSVFALTCLVVVVGVCPCVARQVPGRGDRRPRIPEGPVRLLPDLQEEPAAGGVGPDLPDR